VPPAAARFTSLVVEDDPAFSTLLAEVVRVEGGEGQPYAPCCLVSAGEVA
jgi:hypothetical protein